MEKQLLFIARGDYFRVISFSKSMDLMDTLMSMGDLIHTGDKIYWSNNKDKKLLSKDFSHIKPNSYLLEIENFIKNIKEKRKCSPSAEDGLEIMKMIEYIYSDQ